MNRDKYINNEDYREGYADGAHEAQNTVYYNTLTKLKPLVDALHIFVDEFERDYREHNMRDIAEREFGYCKDCKYFEYDSVANIGEIPLIVAHEICNRWGDGCKSSENGYCFLFEPKAGE